jgi:hypothetical protein
MGEVEITDKRSDSNNEIDAPKVLERMFFPILERDQAGFLRKVYTWGETEFVFKGREELPILDRFESRDVKIFGSNPVHINQDEYELYLAKFKKNDDNPLVLVTMDVQGVIEIAGNLGVKGITQQLQDIRSGKYTQEITELIDKIVACKLRIGDEGSDGEAIVLASMLGDKEAMQFVDFSFKAMTDSDDMTLSDKREDLREQWEINKRFEEVNVKDLVVVHATHYLPRRSEEVHGFEIVPTGEVNAWRYLRNTVHTTLNHKVEGHYGGHWDDTPHVLISPFVEVVGANSSPSGLNMQDTWWILGPGERLKFPKAKLVTPGNVLDGELIEFGEDNTYFKAENYTVRDVFRVDKGRPMVWKHLRGVLNNHMNEINNSWSGDQFWKKVQNKYFPDMSINYLREYCDVDPKDIQKQFLHGDINESVHKRVGQILMGLELREVFVGNQNDFDIELAQITDQISKEISRHLFGEINEMAVNRTIDRMGFPSRNNLVGEIGALGEKFDSFITATSHNYSIYNFLEHDHAADIQSAFDDSSSKFIWTKYDSKSNRLKAKGLDPKTRRVLYVSGMFNSRFKN